MGYEGKNIFDFFKEAKRNFAGVVDVAV